MEELRQTEVQLYMVAVIFLLYQCNCQELIEIQIDWPNYSVSIQLVIYFVCKLFQLFAWVTSQ